MRNPQNYVLLVVERVAKSRAWNRSVSKRSGRVGIPKSRIQVPKKSGILSGIVHLLLQILCFVSEGRVAQKKSGSRKFGYPLYHYTTYTIQKVRTFEEFKVAIIHVFKVHTVQKKIVKSQRSSSINIYFFNLKSLHTTTVHFCSPPRVSIWKSLVHHDFLPICLFACAKKFYTS